MEQLSFYAYIEKLQSFQSYEPKGAVNLSHWADRQANGLFAHPRSNVIVD